MITMHYEPISIAVVVRGIVAFAILIPCIVLYFFFWTSFFNLRYGDELNVAEIFQTSLKWPYLILLLILIITACFVSGQYGFLVLIAFLSVVYVPMGAWLYSKTRIVSDRAEYLIQNYGMPHKEAYNRAKGMIEEMIESRKLMRKSLRQERESFRNLNKHRER